MKRQTGFTLVELLTVAAIVAIGLALAIPSYKYITTSYRMSAEVNALLGDVMYARGEAIKEGQGVTVCVSNSGTTCTGGSSWQNGWIVYSNPTASTTPAAGTILRVQAPFSGNPPDTFVANSAISAITYNREGFATTAAGFPNTLITLHNPSASPGYTRCLAVTPQGLAYTETTATSISTAVCN